MEDTVASPLKGRLDLEKPVKRGTSWLEEGTHAHATIADIDPSDVLRTGRIKAAFEKAGKYHREQIYFTNKAGDDVSYRLAKILGCLFPGPELRDYYQWLTEDDWQDALQALRGMVLNITIQLSEGYRVEFDPDRQLYLAKQNEEVLCEAEQLATVDRICRANGRSKAYRSVAETASGEDAVVQRNLLALRTALQGRKKRAASTTDSAATKNARFIRATPKE